jgi:DNA-binding transcriptional LysR family regulator
MTITITAFNEPWILTAPDTWNYALLAEAFRSRGLEMPRASMVVQSGALRTHMLVGSQCIATFAKSVLQPHADGYGLKMLPVDLPDTPLPVAILTLKERTMSPVVERFIECAHEVAKLSAPTK